MEQIESSAERLVKFRTFATEAWDSARKTQSPELRREYENLALAWSELIAELEQLEAKHSSQTH